MRRSELGSTRLRFADGRDRLFRKWMSSRFTKQVEVREIESVRMPKIGTFHADSAYVEKGAKDVHGYDATYIR
jgi:hypothetical protein